MGQYEDEQCPLRERAREMRLRIRRGEWRHQTSGRSPGIVQGNVVILPDKWAPDFLGFCAANPKPCPVIAISDVGDPRLPQLGEDIDIRTDVPVYTVFRDGRRSAEVPDIRGLWRDDLVTVVLGCSFSFEEALMAAGLRLAHIENGSSVPVYRSNIDANPAGPFFGPVAVSMRPFPRDHAALAARITSRFPLMHGAPVHMGDPRTIGIVDLMKPDFGDAVPIAPGEIPVFWGCGVTPQLAIENARLPFCITHKASHMLITDRLNTEMATS